jgi:Flp pilus assembly protein TadD
MSRSLAEQREAAQAFAAGDLARAERLFRKALSLEPDNPDLVYNLAVVCLQKGDLGEGAKLAAQVVARRPENAAARFTYGRALQAAGDLAAARRELEAAVGLDPAHADARLALGLVAHLIGDEAVAERELAAALELKPDDLAALMNLAAIRLAGGDREAAAALYERALAQRRGLVPALIGLSQARRGLGELEAAQEAAEAAHRQAPDNPDAVAELVFVLERQGDAAAAREVLSGFAGDPAGHPALALAQARLAEDATEMRAAVAALEGVLATAKKLSPPQRRRLSYSLADLHDRLGEPGPAIRAARAANALERRDFDMDGFERRAAQIRRYFDRVALAALPRAPTRGPAPIFIVGMPRSGTTLVEQILDRHSRAAGIGESDALERAIRHVEARLPRAGGYPACLSEAGRGLLTEAADLYRERAAIRAGDRRPVDKMMFNFRHVGLIRLLFPEATVIWCRRRPEDVALSCYFQDFRAAGLAFTGELAAIGRMARCCDALMRHWMEVCEPPPITLDYEELVTDQEAGTRGLLDACGLEFEEGCMRPEKSARYARTASYRQVREPVHRRAVGRATRYADFLEEFRRAYEG